MTRYFTLAIVIPICCVVALVGGCNKKSKKDAAPNYTEKMGGVRNWHGWRKYNRSNAYEPPFDTSYSYPDTSFALTLVNGTTINFFGKDYEYDTVNSDKDTYYYGGGFNGLHRVNGAGLIYELEKNSIQFVARSTSHNGSDWTEYNTF